jgi:hypothetical protein
VAAAKEGEMVDEGTLQAFGDLLEGFAPPGEPSKPTSQLGEIKVTGTTKGSKAPTGGPPATDIEQLVKLGMSPDDAIRFQRWQASGFGGP